MFSRVHEPVLRITTSHLTFSVRCVSRLPSAETVELLFNPVERMIVVRPCAPTGSPDRHAVERGGQRRVCAV